MAHGVHGHTLAFLGDSWAPWSVPPPGQPLQWLFSRVSVCFLEKSLFCPCLLLSPVVPSEMWSHRMGLVSRVACLLSGGQRLHVLCLHLSSFPR